MKYAKIWLTIAGILLLAGVGVFCAAMSANGWDFSSIGGGKAETRTVGIDEAFRSIRIEADTADVVFLLSDDEACTVVLDERKNEKYTAEVRDGTLVITGKDDRSWLDRISLFSIGSAKITVRLPQTEYASLSVDDSTGDVSIPANLRFEEIQIALSTGDLDCRASAAGVFRASASTGRIRLEGLSAGELEITTSTGGVELRSVSCEGQVSVRLSTGDALLADLTCNNLVSEASTGDLALQHVMAEKTITVKRSTGDVTLAQCDAQALEIATDTGDVTGSLLSEKVFLTETDTGRIRLPETTSGGVCRITTDTGDISIQIVP